MRPCRFDKKILMKTDKFTYTGIKDLQEQILDKAFLAFSVFGTIVQLVSISRLIEYGLDLPFVFFNVCYVTVMVATVFRKKLPMALKLWGIITVSILILFVGFYKVGFLSSAKIYIVIVPILVFLVSSFRVAFITLCLHILVYLFWAFLYSGGFSDCHIDAINYVKNPFSWMLDGSVVLLAVSGLLYVSYFYHKVINDNFNIIKSQSSSIKDQEAQYRFLLESSNDAIMVLDHGKCVDCNDRTLSLFKAERDYLIGKTPAEISPEYQQNGERSDEYATRLIKLAGNDEPQVFEWRHYRADNEAFDVSVSLSKVALESRVIEQAVLRDITSHKKYEEELGQVVKSRTEALETANEELKATNDELYMQRTELEQTVRMLHETQAKLVEAEKMRSLGMLTAGVAHEINNPLNFLQGAVYSLRSLKESPDDYTDEEKEDITEKMFYSINEGVRRISDIVKSLNQFSHSKDDLLSSFSVNAVVDNCLLILNNKLKHTCEVIKKYDEEVLAYGNEGKIHQVFLNILSNASFAVGDKGVIRIEVTRDGNDCRVSITDNGPGIGTEEARHIFEPFYTTKPVGEGTGLGLSISQSILKEHGGTIALDSDGKSYTTFIVNLPLKIDYGKEA